MHETLLTIMVIVGAAAILSMSFWIGWTIDKVYLLNARLWEEHKRGNDVLGRCVLLRKRIEELEIQARTSQKTTDKVTDLLTIRPWEK